MKKYRLILLFILNVWNASSQDDRWRYLAGIEIKPQVEFLEKNQFVYDRNHFGYSVGPGFTMAKSKFLISSGLLYRQMFVQYARQGERIDSSNGSLYPYYADDVSAVQKYYDLYITLGVQFGNEKNKISISGGLLYSYLNKVSITQHREFYDPPSKNTSHEDIEYDQFYIAQILTFAYQHKISSRLSFKIEPSIAYGNNWFTGLNLGIFYILRAKE